MASLSNDTGASCVIKVSLSPDTGTLQQALIGHDNTRTKASLSNDTGATTFIPALEGHKPKPHESHQAKVPAAASIEVQQGPLRHPTRSACTDRAPLVITPGRSRCATGLKYLLLHVLDSVRLFVVLRHVVSLSTTLEPALNQRTITRATKASLSHDTVACPCDSSA